MNNIIDLAINLEAHPIYSHQKYEAGVSFLNCLSRGEIDQLAKAYRDRILE